MKMIFKFLAAFAACIAAVSAQNEGPPVGFVRLVHLVAPGEGPLRVKLDGGELLPRGYDLGQATGGIGLPAGGHVVELRKTGVDPVKEKIGVAAGETITLLAYAEKLPPKREGDPPRWAMRLRKLPAGTSERGYRLALISVCDRDELVVRTVIETKRKAETTPLRRFEAANLDLGRNRGGVEVRVGDEVLASVSLDDPGNYVVVVYEDPSGRLRALSFYDPKFEVAG